MVITLLDMKNLYVMGPDVILELHTAILQYHIRIQAYMGNKYLPGHIWKVNASYATKQSYITEQSYGIKDRAMFVTLLRSKASTFVGLGGVHESSVHYPPLCWDQ